MADWIRKGGDDTASGLVEAKAAPPPTSGISKDSLVGHHMPTATCQREQPERFTRHRSQGGVRNFPHGALA